MAKDDALKLEREQIAAGAGLAIAEWSLVESTLTFLFVSLLDRREQPVAQGLTMWDSEEPGRRMLHVLINSVIGFQARVDMVGAAMGEADLSDYNHRSVTDRERADAALKGIVGKRLTYRRTDKLAA